MTKALSTSDLMALTSHNTQQPATQPKHDAPKRPTGWPSFGTGIEHNVVTKPHYTWGLRRDEVCCRRCRSHLGHVFAERNTSMHDRLATFTERQCINGVCLKYIKEPIPAGINPKARLLAS
jgi:peptide methionine sulfoxide reductase MsrB